MAQATTITGGLMENVGTFLPIACVRATGLGTASCTVPMSGMSTIAGCVVMVLDSGGNSVISDADITWSGNTVTIADGASFSLADTYVAYIMAWGTPSA